MSERLGEGRVGLEKSRAYITRYTEGVMEGSKRLSISQVRLPGINMCGMCKHVDGAESISMGPDPCTRCQAHD